MGAGLVRTSTDVAYASTQLVNTSQIGGVKLFGGNGRVSGRIRW